MAPLRTTLIAGGFSLLSSISLVVWQGGNVMEAPKLMTTSTITSIQQPPKITKVEPVSVKTTVRKSTTAKQPAQQSMWRTRMTANSRVQTYRRVWNGLKSVFSDGFNIFSISPFSF